MPPKSQRSVRGLQDVEGCHQGVFLPLLRQVAELDMALVIAPLELGDGLLGALFGFLDEAPMQVRNTGPEALFIGLGLGDGRLDQTLRLLLGLLSQAFGTHLRFQQPFQGVIHRMSLPLALGGAYIS